MPQPKPSADTISELDTPLLRRPADESGPVFNAPWEAQAFAMTLALHERGVFTWKEWADALGAAISDAHDLGDADRGDTYYVHWLTALERISSAKQLVDSALLASRKREWEEAARRTPHGRPIELKAARIIIRPEPDEMKHLDT